MPFLYFTVAGSQQDHLHSFPCCVTSLLPRGLRAPGRREPKVQGQPVMSSMGTWVGTPNHTEPTASGTSPGLMYASYWDSATLRSQYVYYPQLAASGGAAYGLATGSHSPRSTPTPLPQSSALDGTVVAGTPCWWGVVQRGRQRLCRQERHSHTWTRHLPLLGHPLEPQDGRGATG